MTEWGSDEWYDERWRDMPSVLRKLAADTIRKALKDEDQELIRRKHAEYGPHEWIHRLIDTTPEDREKMNALLPNPDDIDEFGWPETMSAHHGFGTAIRNLLRDPEYGAGIKDADLPPAPYPNGEFHSHWDDQYVSAIEAALGLRHA